MRRLRHQHTHILHSSLPADRSTRYAWVNFPDGKRRHVMLTVRLYPDPAMPRGLYALEALGLEIHEADLTYPSAPARGTRDDIDQSAASHNLKLFLSGIKPEHVAETGHSIPQEESNAAGFSEPSQTQASETARQDAQDNTTPESPKNRDEISDPAGESADGSSQGGVQTNDNRMGGKPSKASLPRLPEGPLDYLPAGTPFSAALPENLPEKLADAAAIIDGLHGDGLLLKGMPVTLEKIPTDNPSLPIGGSYVSVSDASGKVIASATRIDPHVLYPLASLLHETGHRIEKEAISQSPDTKAAFEAVIEAVRKSEAFGKLEQDAMEFEKLLGGKEEAAGYADYLKSPEELWARAYYQFIADQSSHPGLRNWRQLQRYGQTPELMSGHWTAEDFKPIHDAIMHLMYTLGWIKK